MAWVRLDDHAPHNAKLLQAGPASCWLWVCSLAHTKRECTSGFVSDEALQKFGIAGADRLASRLVDAGLWRVTGGGFQIETEHDVPLFACSSLTFSRPIIAETVKRQLRRIRYQARRLLPALLIDSLGRCVYCGDAEGPFEVDHVVPLARGGTNARVNLVAACRTCNNKKGDRLL